MLGERLAADLKKSMLGGDKFRTETIKLLKSALMYAKIAEGSELTVNQEIVVVKKEIKKRNEAITLYEQAGRTESAEKERAEAVILQEYAPTSLAGADLKTVFVAFKENHADLFKAANFGAIMGAASASLGDIDKQELAGLIKESLSK